MKSILEKLSCARMGSQIKLVGAHDDFSARFKKRLKVIDVLALLGHRCGGTHQLRDRDLSCLILM